MNILSSQEKESLVVDLLGKNYTLREIAKKAHVSFSFVSKVRKRMTGEEGVIIEEGQSPKQLSITAQAFQLFLEKKSLVDVAICLILLKTSKLAKALL